MFKSTVAAALAVLFALAPVAWGQAGTLVQDPSTDPSAGQYGAPVPEPEASEASAAAGGQDDDEETGLKSNIGGLPFTGLDVIVIAGIALVITGTGFALHRLSEPRH